MARRITIRHGSTVISLPLKSEDSLTLENLKEYFPSANGLICDNESESMEGLIVEDGRIFLNPEIDKYQVFICKDMQNSPSPQNLEFERKKEKINMYRQTILNVSEENPQLHFDTSFNSPAKVSKVTDLRMSRNVPKIKLISCGWKHRFTEEGRYNHKKNPEGGTKQVEMNYTMKYSVEDVIKLCQKQYTSDIAQLLMANSTIKLGLYNEEVIESFTLPNGIDVGLWNYATFNKMSKIHLYLLSTSNKEFMECDSMKDAVMHAKNSGGTISLELKNKIFKNIQPLLSNANDANSKTMQQIENPLADVTNKIENGSKNILKTEDVTGRKCEGEVTMKENCLIPVNDGVSVNEKFILTQNAEDRENSAINPNKPHPISPKRSLFHENSVIIDDGNSIHTSDKNDFCNVQVMKSNYNHIRVLYYCISTSKYSNEPMLIERDRVGMYWKTVDNEEIEKPTPDLDKFDPLDYGYQVSSIFVNGEMMYQLTIDESLQKYHAFPLNEFECGNDDPENMSHGIICDTDKIIGFANGLFGIGVITKCIVQCESLFTWYQDDNIYKVGKGLLWLANIPTDEDHVWHCQISCALGIIQTSKKIKITSKQDTNIILDLRKVEEVARHEFTISQTFLGCGQQGQVMKGEFKGKIIAVKSIRLGVKNTAFIDREIEILNAIVHPNFITLHGVCKEPKRVHLLLEYFDGKALNEIIDDDDLKKDYKFDLKKKNDIIQQICKAVAFLQLQDDPIIHRDLKPENILIDKNGLTKICDFGLSKFTKRITMMTSTVGNPKGTMMYMAPELLIDNEPATIASDIWSLAATIAEIYQEHSIWNVSNDTDLKEALINKNIPDISSVPDQLQRILLKCFSYEKENRPSISAIISDLHE